MIKRIFLSGILIMLFIFSMCSCKTGSRKMKDLTTSVKGIERTIKVYSYDGKLMNTYEGKVDIENSKRGNKVKFELNGKRIIIYNAIVIVEEK